MKIQWINYALFSLIIIVLASCGNKNSVIKDTPTSGKIKIAVDESFTLLLETEIYTFEKLYQYSSITTIDTTEGGVAALLLADSVRVAFMCRELTKKETDFLNSKQIIPKTTKIAFDGLAFIINKTNVDSTFTEDQLKNIFMGKAALWTDINKKSSLNDIKAVFDNNNSANLRYIKERFKIESNLPSYCYAVSSNEEVVNYVEKTPSAIGIISVNWISDKNDSISNRFLNKIKVAGIDGGDGYFYKPYQAYIADGSYPFTRSFYAINIETFSGLGSGFVNFVAADQGQRIVLKSGLVPATMPVRLVQVKR